MAKSKASPSVDEYMAALVHPLSETIELLRQTVLATDQTIGEQVKWNSPSFWFTGEMAPFDPKEYKRDIVVFNLHRQDHVLLVFPTGATIADRHPVLEGKYADGRRTIKISSMEEAQQKADAIQEVIKHWLTLIDK